MIENDQKIEELKKQIETLKEQLKAKEKVLIGLVDMLDDNEEEYE